jgi:pimeloyl-ACP methyl ester carboxylesterase
MHDFNDLIFQVDDGLSLYARDYPGPYPGAPVVMLLHGLTRNSRDFADVAPALAGTHRVLVPEQRGRGRSDYDPVIERYQPATYAGDMLALLAQEHISQVAVVGTSMGGIMAMIMHALQPTLLRKVVLNDIGPELAKEGLERIKTHVGMASSFATWAHAAQYARQVNQQAFPHYGSEDWLAFAHRLCIERDDCVVLDYDLAIGDAMRASAETNGLPDLWPLFDLMRSIPVLLIRGALSDLLDEDCASKMAATHPQLTRLEVPEVGHAPMLTELGVVEAIRDFLLAESGEAPTT